MITCPDCQTEITSDNPVIKEEYNPEAFGSCYYCYDATPYDQPQDPRCNTN